jgi:predicted metal-dependent hydrolase
VQLEFILSPTRIFSLDELLTLGDRQIRLVLVRNPQARRYVLRLRPDGAARVTVPRGGSALEARRFAERNKNWIERQLQKLDAYPKRPKEWLIGTEILFRGVLTEIKAGANGERDLIRLGSESVKVADSLANLHPEIQKHLWELAEKELPPVVWKYAALHQLMVRKVKVGNQKSRWGSCSRRGTVSLNWRLLQTPLFVRDYLCLHELAHLREMNHSSHFWHEVERLCPGYKMAEQWLKKHSALLM